MEQEGEGEENGGTLLLPPLAPPPPPPPPQQQQQRMGGVSGLVIGDGFIFDVFGWVMVCMCICGFGSPRAI